MKNVHIFQTDQPSRLYINTATKEVKLSKEKLDNVTYMQNQNIYITNNEEIKEGDYCIDGNDIYGPYENGDIATEKFSKIILTTDQDLIKDGVQAIDDEFLEWFVKNTTCEFVDVIKEMYVPQSNGKISDGRISHEISLNPSDNTLPFYKIIIPKVEPNQWYNKKKPNSFCETPNEKCTMNYCDENGCQNRKRNLVEIEPEQIWNTQKMEGLKSLIDMMKDDEELELYEEPDPFELPKALPDDVFYKSLESKQETIEEACKRIAKELDYSEFDYTSFKLGAKWQQERMYSEEDMIDYADYTWRASNNNRYISPLSPKEWFTQFKKEKAL